MAGRRSNSYTLRSFLTPPPSCYDSSVSSAAAAAGKSRARFGFGNKKAPAKKAFKPSNDQPLWFPRAKAPEYLDGSLVGDYGFQPFGLGKAAEHLQFELNSLDQNLAKNEFGGVIGTRTELADLKSTPFQPTTRCLSSSSSGSGSSPMATIPQKPYRGKEGWGSMVPLSDFLLEVVEGTAVPVNGRAHSAPPRFRSRKN